MAYKVLVVDDSSFFQVRLKEIINEHPDLDVVGVAANGHESIELATKLDPDVISMDYEMPYLNGASAIRAILAKRWVPIIMFSSMTYEGAHTTLECLDAGAVDFIPKNFAEVSKNNDALKRRLHETLLMFARKASAERTLQELRAQKAITLPSGASVKPATVSELSPAARSIAAESKLERPLSASNRKRALAGKVDVVIIGSSTGGPVALTEVLTRLPSDFRCPVVVIQHMPQNFTKALADRLNKQCHVMVSEAQHEDPLKAGHVYIAPGGHQCIFDRSKTIKIMDADERVNYKPSVDVTFASAANIFGAKVLGIVLTGMGADGCEGAKLLKQKGAVIWGQDQASCVVYGMPKAIAQANLTDDVIALSNIGDRIVADIQ